MARCRARVCSLSLSLFPLKYLSLVSKVFCVSLFLAHLFSFCAVNRKTFQMCFCFSVFSMMSYAPTSVSYPYLTLPAPLLL